MESVLKAFVVAKFTLEAFKDFQQFDQRFLFVTKAMVLGCIYLFHLSSTV